MSALDVLALDLATVSGWARGEVGQITPSCGSVRFAKKGASQIAVAGNALSWLIETLSREPRPDVLAIEEPLPSSFTRGKTNKDTVLMLPGLVYQAMGVAFLRGIYDVRLIPVAKWRSHFIDMNAIERREAKMYVLRKARSLGWLDSSDDNAADAAGIWSFVCSKIDATQALRVSPLFQQGMAI